MYTVRSVVPMRTAKTGYIIVSLLLCLFGGMLLCKPDFSTALIGSLAGWLMIAFGIFKLIGYFSRDLYRLAFQFDLAFGVLMLVIGIIILTKPENLLQFICIVTGLSVTADSLLKLQTAADAKRFGIGRWWMILLAGILTGVLGILLLTRPAASANLLVRLFGAVMLAEGILNLVTVLLTVKIIHNQRPDIIDAYYEEGD